jgi:hypothetical protein
MNQKEKIILSADLLKKLRELDVIDEIALRDEAIKREYFRRLKESLSSGGGNKKKKKIEIKTQLAEEHSLKYETIDQIVYRKQRRKKPLPNLIKELK